MKGNLRVVYVPTAENAADLFTKPLSADRHSKLRQMIGLTK